MDAHVQIANKRINKESGAGNGNQHGGREREREREREISFYFCNAEIALAKPAWLEQLLKQNMCIQSLHNLTPRLKSGHLLEDVWNA